jgi:small-conductance mechanosensitive channel
VLSVWVWAENLSVSIAMKSDILITVLNRFRDSGIELAYPRTKILQ